MQYATSDRASATLDLQRRIIGELTAKKRVLWVVSGGSNIDVAGAVMAAVDEELQSKLTIMLSDERYGPVGHADSNFKQLSDKGFEPRGATWLPVLHEGLSLIETAAAYGTVVREAFGAADIIIAQLGIGSDGHIAGILPNSPAVSVSDTLVTGYLSDPYQRVTMTFRALQAIDVDYTLAYGGDKQPALEQLQQSNLSLSQQPSMILKQLPEAHVYNDSIGDST